MLKAKLLLATLFFLLSSSTVLGQEFEISGNGESSSSNIEITNETAKEVVQTNTANVENNITITANTGGNTVTDSAGATINTGNIVATIAVENIINTSIEQTAPQTKNEDPKPAEIKSNGADSINQIAIKKEDKKAVTASNSAKVENNVDTNLNTGDNTASKNAGDVVITSGSVFAHIVITNKVNSNIAIGGVCKKPELPILPHFNNPTSSSSNGSSSSSSSSGVGGGGPSILGLSATSSQPNYYPVTLSLIIAALILRKFRAFHKKI